MLDTAKKVIYKAFGLSISSEIPLPELYQQFEEYKEEADITIEVNDVPKLWDEFSPQRQKFVLQENLVMFHVPNIAIFSIQDGKKILISPKKGCDEEIIRLYVLGTCMGAILMQRRVYPLHGSAVEIDGKAYAFIGDSGAGKSTLASVFLNQGYKLVSDDVIAVSLSQGRPPIVTPSYPQQKLWQQSLHAFGMETSQYRSIYGRETKYCVPVSSQFFNEPLPLAGVFELIKTEHEMVRIEPIQGLERLQTLHYHTYRHFLISRLGLLEWHFNTTNGIAKLIDMFRIQRPVLSFTANELASLILSALNKEE